MTNDRMNQTDIASARKRDLERTALGIAAMFGIYWIYIIFLRGRLPVSEGVQSLLGLFCLYGPGLGAFVCMTRGTRVQRREKKKLPAKTMFMCVLLQFSAILIMVVFVNVLAVLGGGIPQEGIGALSPGMLFLLLVFNPVMEEAVFRRMFADRLLWHGEGFYMLASSLCFAVVHGVSLGVPQVVYTFILGLVWSYVMVQTGDFMQVVLLHAASNLFGSVILQGLQMRSEVAAGIYAMLLMLLGVVGIVLFVVRRKHIVIDQKQGLFKKETLAEVLGNRGIWVYSIITLVAMILSYIG